VKQTGRVSKGQLKMCKEQSEKNPAKSINFNFHQKGVGQKIRIKKEFIFTLEKVARKQNLYTKSKQINDPNKGESSHKRSIRIASRGGRAELNCRVQEAKREPRFKAFWEKKGWPTRHQTMGLYQSGVQINWQITIGV